MQMTYHTDDRTQSRSTARTLPSACRPEESNDRLRAYFDHLRRFTKEDATIRISGSHVYIYDGNTLVTVLGLPSEHRVDMQRVLRACCGC
ncbi:MAG: hypothetical protein FWD84_02505 [Oscillospiraceae bacterium]|nr:hypothetical protein [Oscillospiraceae bacterium]